MAKYVSGRVKNLKVGITSYSEDKTSLTVLGNVGIGTDIPTDPVGASNTSVLAVGIITATKLVKSGGLPTEFLKADGSVDNTNYGSETLDDILENGNSSDKGIKVGISTLGNVSSGFVELYHDSKLVFQTTGIGVSVASGTAKTAYIEGPEEIWIDPHPVGVGTTSGIVRIKGDLYVDGTEFIVNSETITLGDFVVGIATTATTDALTDGAGIGIGSIGNEKTFKYEYNSGTNPSLKSSENLNVASGKGYQIAQTEVLNANTLSVGTGATVHSPSSNVITLGTNNTERLRIDSTGNVGIGTDIPTDSVGASNTSVLAVGIVTATKFNAGGTSSQYLMADGSVSTGSEGTDGNIVGTALSISGIGTIGDTLKVGSGITASAGVITATTFDGNAGTATSLANARTIGGVSFDGTADITPNVAAGLTNTPDITVGTIVGTALSVSGISSVGAAITMYGATGNIVGTALSISGGTSSQYLMADGSVSTGSEGSGGNIVGTALSISGIGTIGDTLKVGIAITASAGVITATSFSGKLNNLTFPSANGIDGQVLTSDGNGIVQWEDATGGTPDNIVGTALSISGIGTIGDTLKVGIAITASAGVITATKFVKSGGTGSQYLMADGSVSTGSGGSGNIVGTALSISGIGTIGDTLKVGTAITARAGIITANIIHLKGGNFNSVTDAAIVIDENVSIYNAESTGNTLTNLIEKNNNVIDIGAPDTAAITEINLKPGNTGTTSLFAGNYGSAAIGILTANGSGVEVSGILTATTLVKSGGTSSQYLMADGSVSTGTGGADSGLWVANTTGIHTLSNIAIGNTTASDATLVVDVGSASTAVVVKGSQGRLFSVTNSLTSGSIFSVNDITGIPSIDVDADGTIQLAPFGSTENVGLGITNPTSKLHVVGDARITGVLTTGQIADSNGSVGAASSVLSSTGSGLAWVSNTGGSGSGIDGITVKDEGTALSTLATTLNFEGTGVTATGTGAEKTITISGGGGGGGSPGGSDTQIQFNNSGSFGGSANLTFDGTTVTGTISTANRVALTNSSSVDSEYYLTFVDSWYGNENLRTDYDGIRYNPSTQILTNDTFKGNLTGIADTANKVALTNSNTLDSNCYLTFVDSWYGNENLRTDYDGIRYNPNTEVLSGITEVISTTFTGNLTGIADTANKVALTNSSSVDSEYYLTFVDSWYGNENLRTDNNGIRYNPSTEILTNDTFKGNLTGIADTANKVALTNNSTTDSEYYLVFVDSWYGNENLRTDSNGIRYNPSTEILTNDTFKGNLTGIADTANKVALTNTHGTDSTYYITFVDSSSGYENLRVDSNGLTYNPSTEVLTGVSFSGNLTGDVTGNADTADKIALTNTHSTDSTYYITFVDSSSGYENLRVDSNGLTYNPSTEVLTGVTFNGALTGNADTATKIAITNTHGTNSDYYLTFVDSSSGNEDLRVDSNGIKYNPDTEVISGASIADATNASKVNITNTWSTDSTHYLTFVDSTSGNEDLRVDSNGIKYNPSTNTLSGIAVTASSVKVTNTWSTDSTHYMAFVDSASGINTIKVDSNGARYNPSTNTLSGIAVTASSVKVINTHGTDDTYYVAFVDSTSGINTIRVDSNGLTYNPNTEILAGATIDDATNAEKAYITNTWNDDSDYYITFADGVNGNKDLRADSDGIRYNPSTNTLSGVAVTATQVLMTNSHSDNTEYYLTFVDDPWGLEEIRADSSGPRYNPSTNTLSGIAVTATQVLMTNSHNDDTEYYLTFVDDPWGLEEIRADSSGPRYNPSTNTLTGVAVTATGVLMTNSHNDNTDYYVTFVDGPWGVEELRGDSVNGLRYNPSTGTLTATTFSGTLSGSVSNATNASHVLVTDNENENENNLIPFIEDGTSATGNVGLEMDGDFHYNPSTGNLSATKFTGDGSGLTDLPGGLWVSNATGIHTVSNVGIGTTTASDASLVVDVGTASTAVVVQGSEGQLFSVTNSLSSGSIFSVNDISGVPSIDVDADGTIQLAPYSTTENVGVGTTNPTSKLHVVGGTKITGVLTTGQIADSSGSVGTAASVLSSTGSGLSWVENAGGDVVDDTSPQLGGYLDLNSKGIYGVGVVTATDFNSTSDIRLKTNIKPIDDPLAKVIQIEGVSFNWKQDNRPALGVIADQVQEIIPELVRGDDPKTVNYNGLIGLLIEAVKEQQTQIDNLNERLSKLE